MGLPRQILLLTSGFTYSTSTPRMMQLPGLTDVVVRRDQYELPDMDLMAYAGVLIPTHADQRALSAPARRAQFAAYLERGGTVVTNGHIVYPFLPGHSMFQPIQDCTLADLYVHRMADHPVWDGVSEDSLSLRKGVAGFYGRGWHQPPKGAQIVNALGPQRYPLDIIWQVGAGRVLLHGGNDLWTFGKTGTEIVPGNMAAQLLTWILQPAEDTDVRRH